MVRGHLFPHQRQVVFNQRRSIAEDQRVARIATLGEPLTVLVLHFEHIPLATYLELKAFLEALPGSARAFTFTDQDNTVYTVRWWPDGEPVFNWPETTYQQYSGDLLLRIEAA